MFGAIATCDMTTTSDLENGISEMLHDAGERLTDLKDGSVDTIGKQAGAVAKLVKKHPLAAIGVSVGVGFVLSRVIRWI
jgi:ElaB/YqjD/DUF883 family membrane-anchored ribosome-binding protein